MANPTVSFYDQNAREFYKNTVSVDMKQHYGRFEKYLLPGSSILDAGCGSGRDSQYFLSKGYKVEAFDASGEMVKLSSKLTGLSVRQATFAELNSDVRFNGIWASASLLHVGKGSMAKILKKLAAMLTEHGVFFMSFKYGDKVYVQNDRLFNGYDETSFREMISAVPELAILELYVTADVRKERSAEYWLSAIVKKV